MIFVVLYYDSVNTRVYLNLTILFKPLKHATFHRFFLFYYNFHSIDHSLLMTSLIINQFIRFPDPIKRL